MKYLYLALLGGKTSAGRFGEDHEMVMVVAENIDEAKKMAKHKWSGVESGLHIDDIIEVNNIDGYDILLRQQ